MMEDNKNLNLDPVSLQNEIKILRQKLELQEWGLKKTDQGIKLLYNELEQKNKDLEKIDQLKSDFISNVSHELRTPLTTIKESISLVLDGVLGPVTDQQKEFLTICFDDTNRLAKIINDLLDISKIESGKIALYREKVDMGDLVEKIFKNFSHQVSEKGLTFEREISEGVSPLYIDKDKIIQVLLNLVGNAVKFTTKGSIKISVEDKGDHIQCMVVDTGKGISLKDMDELFDRFKQFGKRSGPQQKGTGLGLAISKNIIELHNGRIWVESEENEGSKFIFTLRKYSEKEVLLEKIETIMKREEVQKEHIAIVRIQLAEFEDKYDERKVRDILDAIGSAAGQTLTSEEYVFCNGQDTLYVFIEMEKNKVLEVQNRVRRIVKDMILDITEDYEMNFFVSHAVYPEDAAVPEKLLMCLDETISDDSKLRLNKRIMIVDDEQHMVKIVRVHLEKLGYTSFDEAYGGAEVMALVEKNIPDLIILDMQMPELSGYEVIGRLKEKTETANIPILIMSAYQLQENRLKQYVTGNSIPTMRKPFQQGELDKWVAYLL